MFERMASPALEAALAKLPADFQMTGKYCIAPDCIFSCAEVGKRMRTSGDKKYCLFCSRGPQGRLTAEKSGTGLEALRRCLASYEASAAMSWSQLGPASRMISKKAAQILLPSGARELQNKALPERKQRPSCARRAAPMRFPLTSTRRSSR
jgi:hypothetical protein